MSQMSKQKTTIYVVLAIVGLIFLGKYLMGSSSVDSLSEESARIKGAANAPVKIVEFIDFQCPACAKGALYLKDFMKEHPEFVRLEMKYYPLAGLHKHAILSARYAECAARQNKFWPYHDHLVGQQERWKNLINAIPAFDLIAKETGLDEGELRACLADESVDDVIGEHKAEGRSLGVKSTPTYFINEEMVVGKKSLETLLTKYLTEHEG